MYRNSFPLGIKKKILHNFFGWVARKIKLSVKLFSRILNVNKKMILKDEVRKSSIVNNLNNFDLTYLEKYIDLFANQQCWFWLNIKNFTIKEIEYFYIL